MDDITKKIINIDNITLKMKSRYEVMMTEKEDKLRDSILEIEKIYSNDTIIEGDKVYQDIINTVELELKGSGKAKINYSNMDNNYNKIKGNLIEDIWEDLFVGKE